MTRSFVMALAARAPFRGAWTALMNEYFATSADVHRILDSLPDDADKMATADGREKTVEASRARLARMIGREADEGGASEWDGLAAWFAEAQVRDVADAAMLRLSRNDVSAEAPVIAAGSAKLWRLRLRGACDGTRRIFFADRGPRGSLALRARGRGRVAWRGGAIAALRAGSRRRRSRRV